MKLILSFLLVWQFSFVLNAKETIEFLSTSKAKEIFDYEDKLEVSAEIPRNFKSNKGFLWGQGYMSSDKILVYSSIIFQPHSLLTPKHIENLKMAKKSFNDLSLKKNSSKEKEIQEIEKMHRSIKPIKLRNGAEGFIQFNIDPNMSLMGIVTDPQERFDLALVFFNLIRESKSNILPATKKYLEGMDVEKISKLLENSLNQIYPEMEAQYQKIISTSVTNQTNLIAPPQEKENQPNPEIKQADIPSEKQTLNWIWIGFVLLGLVVALFLFYYWRNK